MFQALNNFSQKRFKYLILSISLLVGTHLLSGQETSLIWKISPYTAINTSSQHHNINSYGVKLDYYDTDFFSASGRIELGRQYFRVSANLLSALSLSSSGYYTYYEWGYYTSMAFHIPLGDELTFSPELSLLDFVYIGNDNWYDFAEEYDFYDNELNEWYMGSSIGASIHNSMSKLLEFSIFADALYLHGKGHTTLNYGLRLGFKIQ